MAHQIEKKDGYFEVRISGKTSKNEVLQVIGELHLRDPGKNMPDLWLAAEESLVPFIDFSEIAQGIRSLLPPESIGNKTAIVAATEFQKAQLELYRTEATILPFEIRMFLFEDEAVKWLMSPKGSTASLKGYE